MLQGLAAALPFREIAVIEQFFFQGPFFLSWHIHSNATFAPYLQVLHERISDVQFSSTQKSLSCRLRAWKLPWGAAEAPKWSCKGFWCVPWVLHSQQSMFRAAACPFCWGEKAKGYQRPYLYLASEEFPPSLWASLQEEMVEHAVRFLHSNYPVQGAQRDLDILYHSKMNSCL